jgi:hypothetical protein
MKQNHRNHQDGFLFMSYSYACQFQASASTSVQAVRWIGPDSAILWQLPDQHAARTIVWSNLLIFRNS